MSAKNSIICIAKDINIDRNYKNTLALSSSAIAGLMESGGHNLYYGSDYSFLRTERRIKVQTSFSQIFSGNYCYIVNQGIRQFFFIDQINYIADNTTEIFVTEDVLTTYKHNGFNNAYCERQHPQTDNRYSNTISEPLQPSNYMRNGSVSMDVSPTDFKALFSEAWRTDGTFGPVPAEEVGILNQNQINTLHIVGGEITPAGLQTFVAYYDNYIRAGKGGDLVALYTRPTPRQGAFTVTDITDFDGYTPKNNKLFNYPYSILHMTNNAGSTIDLKPELLGSRNFKYVCADNGKAQSFCYPENYMNRPDNTDYGLLIENYPSIPIAVDSYTEWLGQAQNGLAEGLTSGVLMAGLSIALAPVTGGMSLAGLAGVATSAVGSSIEMATHIDNTPDTVKGRASGSIINMALNNYMFTVERQTCTREQAERIDDFFTRFGYAQNKIMPISQTNPRFHCHYVKTASGECVIHGIPHEKQDIINNAFNSGVTFWDSNDSIGNYNLK